MRTLVLLLSALVIGPSFAVSQEPAPRPALVDDVPEGTNWVANARTRTYYTVGCPITLTIPAADKLYYKNESSLQAAGFTRSSECVAPQAVGQDSAAAVTPAPAQQQQKAPGKHVRRGFWFNGGLGYGSLGCRDCGDREESVSGALALGGSVSQKVLLGGGTNWWAKSQNDATLTMSTLLAVIRFYPSATGGFFLLGGLGVGTVQSELSGFGDETWTGLGGLVGLGWDIRVGRNLSLTPFWNGFWADTDDLDANVGQLGLGLTVH